MYLSQQLRCALFASRVRFFLSFNSLPTPEKKRSPFAHVRFLLLLFFTSSDPLSAQKLAKGDVVKVHLGAHIDGFAAITAETIVVGATPESPVTGRRADALRAAWTAAEVAMRLVRVGNKNWQVTEAVSKVAAEWGCKAVEGTPFHSFFLLCHFVPVVRWGVLVKADICAHE
jgi:methionine aminopeptidase